MYSLSFKWVAVVNNLENVYGFNVVIYQAGVNHQLYSFNTLTTSVPHHIETSHLIFFFLIGIHSMQG